MDEIKKLLNIQVSPYSKFINFLNFIKKLIFNFGIIKFLKYLLNKDKNKYENYKKTWKQQIEKDIKLNQNWRRDRKHFLDMINFDLLKQIFDLISRDKEVIMDLGSYDGYFIKYYSSFNKVVLSDITPYSKLNLNDQKFKFCLLNGRDLKNINSLSLDVVFSIDTLIRLDRQTLKSYFSDFGRIVKEGGYLILHIPDLFNMSSIAMSYTPISRIFFYKLIKKYFNNIIFTNNLHSLSTFLIAKRNSVKFEED